MPQGFGALRRCCDPAAVPQENPVSGALLAIDPLSPTFNGALSLQWQPDTPDAVKAEGDPNDVRWGDWTQLATGTASFFARGMRCAYGLFISRTGVPRGESPRLPSWKSDSNCSRGCNRPSRCSSRRSAPVRRR